MNILRDLRYAARLLWNSKGYAFFAIAILGLCLGANTAILSIGSAMFLRPLPYPEPERLLQVVTNFRAGGAAGQRESQDGSAWEAIRDSATALDAAVFSDWTTGVNFSAGKTPGYVQQQRVSAGFFRVLGVAPALGREFDPTEDREGGPRAVILSHGLWKSTLGGDSGVVGRAVLLRGEPYTVVGVMPAGFRSSAPADLWTPLKPNTKGEGSGSNYAIVSRLKPGATLAQAEGQLAGITADLVRARALSSNSEARLGLIPLRQGMTSEMRKPVTLLWAAVGVLLLLGCVNVSGMVLERTSRRTGEIATRLALGASPAAIVRQLLAESILLALLGCVAAIAIGAAALRGLKALAGDLFPFVETATLDVTTLAGAALLATLAAAAFGTFPALQARRSELRPAHGGRSIAGPRRFVSMGAMLGVQAALTVTLLAGAGLLIRSFHHLWTLDPGFDPRNVLTARFSLQDARYADAGDVRKLVDRTLANLSNSPGVEAAAVTLSLPFERGLNMPLRQLKDTETGRPGLTNLTYASPGLLDALRIPLRAGRWISDADRPDTAPVAVINEAFRKAYLRDTEPVGQMVHLGRDLRAQVIGVIGDVQQRPGWGNVGPLAPVPSLYIPVTQAPADFLNLVHTWFSPNWVIRGSMPQAMMAQTIRAAMEQVDPLLPVAKFRRLDEIKAGTLQLEQLLSVLLGALATLAALLTALGIYGMTSNLVTSRKRELGVRLALGASTGEAVGAAVRPAIAWVAAGAAIGILAAVAMSQLIESFLWGVRPADPLTLGAVSLGVALLTVLGTTAPALRVARLNPADTIRAE
ncbi:MAG: ADOP family duplicated permease [Bryobacteraceae bacterium]|nr:ADOP family duplicated permease [Bryobacteraceae bacterium]